MGTPRPLQIPWQVGITFSLDALLLNIGNPLRIEPNPGESIRLANTEGNDGCQPTRQETDDDQCPLI